LIGISEIRASAFGVTSSSISAILRSSVGHAINQRLKFLVINEHCWLLSSR
jgi:hypothetical protein